MKQQKPWLEKYPAGVPVNIDADSYCSVTELLDETFNKYRKKIAFTCMGKDLSYNDVDKKSMQMGAYLISRGLKPGDKVAVMMPNLLQYPIALYGILRAGLVVVNTNPLYTPREMLHQFNDSEAKAIIIAENFAANLQKIKDQTQIDIVITTSIGEMLGFPKKALVNFVVRRIKRMVPSYNIPNAVSFTEALNQGKKFKLDVYKGDAEDVILLQYTGGTTGVSKGAMLTNRNMIANMLQMQAIWTPFLDEGKEVALCPLPLYHIFAFTVHALGLFSYGAKNVLITNARDLGTVMDGFKKDEISVMSGVNTLFNALLNQEKFKDLDFSHLKVVVGGGAAVQKPVAEKWEAVTGVTLSEGYGMTESSPVVTINPLDKTGRIGSIGLPVPSTDVRIVDENFKPLGVGEVGEIQVKGPQVMKGYYRRPQDTEATIVDGWLCTGDIGLMHEDGFFQIVDRKKDMILVSGFNVFPNEIEEVIADHDKVLEVAAIGVPNERSGEAVRVYVVKKDKSLKEDELIKFCRESLTGYKVPKQIVFKDELPKSNVGKILRRELRDEAMKEFES